MWPLSFCGSLYRCLLRSHGLEPPPLFSPAYPGHTPAMNVPYLVRPLVLLTTLVTGFTALVYEVTWQTYLANLLGSQSRSSSIVIATFLGGLSLGYWAFGRASTGRDSRTLIQGCGLLEAAIGLWALLFPFMYAGLWCLRVVFPTGSESLVSDILFSILLIAAPATLMGATLPLLTQGLSLSLADAAPFHARIYVVNTVGAFLGSLGAAFILIPSIGLSSTMSLMGIVNLIAGGALFGLGYLVPAKTFLPVEALPSSEVEPRSLSLWTRNPLTLLPVTAFLGGFTSITLQTVLIRVVALSVGSSTYAFAVVVSAFILALALGAWFIAERRGARTSLWCNQVLIAIGLLLLYFIAPRLPYSSHVLRTLLTSQSPNFWVYHCLLFFGLLAVIIIPVGANGATLPLIFREGRNSAETLGDKVGRVYGCNAVGCVLGAILGGYLSLYWLDLHGVLRSITALSVLTLVPIAMLRPNGISWFSGATIAILFSIALSTSPWPSGVMGHGLFRMTQADSVTYAGFKSFYDHLAPGDNLIAYDDDPNSTIMVDGYANGSRSIWVNGKSDGSTRGGDRTTTLLVGHLPALFQRSTSDKVTVIGFGTGITTGALTRRDQFKEVNVLEISSAVRNFSPLFDRENGAASRNTKIRWHLGDAYRFLIESSDVYAVIASEPSNPWVGGVERLYSQEFYQIVRQKLAHRGVFAQWFHTYSISDKTLVMVLKTFSSVFPHAHFFSNGGDIILLGSIDPFDRETIELAKTRMEAPNMARDLRDMGITNIKDLFTREELVPWSGFSGAPLHTLDKPKLSHAAGRDFFLGANANIRTITQKARYIWHARKSLARTLLGVSVFSPNKVDYVKSIARARCNVLEPTFFSGWDRQGLDCQVPLFSLLVMNQIPRPTNVAAETVSILQGVQTEVQFALPPAEDSQSARVGLTWIQQYGAPFLEIDPMKVKRYAEICFVKSDEVALACRGQLALTLLANGFEELGREEFSRIVSDGALSGGHEMMRALKENFLDS